MQYTFSEKAFNEIENNSEGIDIRPNYSGRFMYGSTCLGIVADKFSEVADVLKSFYEHYVNVEHDTAAYGIDGDQAIDEFCDLFFSNMRTDSMGMSTIYYFPDIQVDLSEDEDSDSE